MKGNSMGHSKTASRLLALLLTTCALGASAKPKKNFKPAANPEPVKVTSLEGITEYELANGLHVLLFPDQSKPEMTVNITYVVGSRNESYGETGMAHLLEHLMFKGTDMHPDVPKVLNSLGARFNGTTSFDRTNYFVSFPASEANLAIALDLEADRMIASHIAKNDLWNEKEKRGEMTVVRNEMEQGENSPAAITLERLASVAFDWHNYGKSTIGARSDVENVNIEHLQAFYQRYYQPDNAWLLVAGKIDEAGTLKLINDKFGNIRRPARTLEKTWTTEPVQDGERTVTIRRVGGTPFLAIGYHVPQTANPDSDSIALVAQALDAPPSGRLYKALVETKLATQTGDMLETTAEPGLLQFFVELPKDGNVAAVQAAALGVIEGLKEHPLTQEEVERVRASQIKAYEQSEQHTDRLATELSDYIAAGDWRLYFVSRDRTEAITQKAMQGAAEKYFKASNRTLAQYIPTDKPDRADLPQPTDIPAMVRDYKGRAPVAEGEQFDPTPKNIEDRLVRFGTKDGMRGALLPKKSKGAAVNFEMTLRFGSEEALMNLGSVPRLAGALLERGTKKHDWQSLKDTFDKLKTQVQIAGEPDGCRVLVNTDREHFAAALDLLAEVLKNPAFPEGELAKARAAELTELESQKSEPQAIAFTTMQVAIDPYPAGHPKAARTLEQLELDVKAATLDEIKAFHSVFYGADHATISAVGDFDAREVQAQLEKLFGDWKSSQPYVRVATRAAKVAPLDRQLLTPDKANAWFVAVAPVPLKDSDTDYAPFLIADRMLGGGALKSRLADRIRQKEGLSYGIGSHFQANGLDPAGQWLAYAIYAPQNVSRLDAAFKEELQTAAATGFTADELAFSKNTWLQERQISRTQDNELVHKLGMNSFYGRTMEFDAALEAKVAALSLDEVNAAYRKYLDYSKLTIIKAGDFNKPTAAK